MMFVRCICVHADATNKAKERAARLQGHFDPNTAPASPTPQQQAGSSGEQKAAQHESDEWADDGMYAYNISSILKIRVT